MRRGDCEVESVGIARGTKGNDGEVRALWVAVASDVGDGLVLGDRVRAEAQKVCHHGTAVVVSLLPESALGARGGVRALGVDGLSGSAGLVGLSIQEVW